MHLASLHAHGLKPRGEVSLDDDSTFARILDETDPEAMSRLWLDHYKHHMFINKGGATLIVRNDKHMSFFDSESGWSLMRIGAWARTCAEKFGADQFVLGCHALIRPLAISNSQEKILVAISIGGHRDHAAPFISSAEVIHADLREAPPVDGLAPLWRTPAGELRAVTGFKENHLADMVHVRGIFSNILPWRPLDPEDLEAA